MTSPLSIILTDDDPHFLVFLKHVFKDLQISCEITALKYGDELIELLSNQDKHYDGILLDMNMPRKNGAEVLAEMRKGNLRPEIPVIVMSLAATDSCIANIMSLGATAYLEKPFGLDEFKSFAQKMTGYFTEKSGIPPHSGKA